MDSTEEILRRLEELETRMAFQEELLGRLDEVVGRDDREIVSLKSLVVELGRRLRELAAAGPGEAPSPDDEHPPHY